MAQSKKISIYGNIVPSDVDGPGTRAVIHFAGCSIGCAGCFNPHTHDASAPGVWRDTVDNIAAKMLEVSDAVTISGGEPTDQMSGLYELCRALRQRGCSDIVMFTGRRIEQLQSGPWASVWNLLISEELVDVVVDGPFMKRRLADSGLRGSDNQRIIPVTDKWDETDFASRDVEFAIGPNGEVVLTGFPDSELLGLFA